MPSLVIVDVQSSFGPYTKKMIDSIVNLIEQFRLREDPIFVVKLTDCGRVHERIRKAVASYRRLIEVYKDDEDGSREIMAAMRKRKFRTRKFLVCGVNFEACVKETARGLISRNKNHIVNIHLESTNADKDVRPTKKTRRKNLSYI